MSCLRGMTRVCIQTFFMGSLALGGCAGAPNEAATGVPSQTAALEVAGAGGGAPMFPPDEIVGPFTQDLAGTSLVYRYTHGGDYYITYGTDTVTFRLPLPDGSHTPPITVPYYARALRGRLYMVHWVNPERTVHVTQVVDLPRRQVHVSALMPGQWQLFDVGNISEITRAKQGE